MWQVAEMQLPERMLQACTWLLCVGQLHAATFKLALLGPWSCDPMFSRAMPTAAANLALSRIQSDNSLNRGFSYSIKLLEEDCSVSKGESVYLTADCGSGKSRFEPAWITYTGTQLKHSDIFYFFKWWNYSGGFFFYIHFIYKGFPAIITHWKNRDNKNKRQKKADQNTLP